jgi:hypothetical protein
MRREHPINEKKNQINEKRTSNYFEKKSLIILKRAQFCEKSLIHFKRGPFLLKNLKKPN